MSRLRGSCDASTWSWSDLMHNRILISIMSMLQLQLAFCGPIKGVIGRVGHANDPRRVLLVPGMQRRLPAVDDSEPGHRQLPIPRRRRNRRLGARHLLVCCRRRGVHLDRRVQRGLEAATPELLRVGALLLVVGVGLEQSVERLMDVPTVDRTDLRRR